MLGRKYWPVFRIEVSGTSYPLRQRRLPGEKTETMEKQGAKEYSSRCNQDVGEAIKIQ